MLTEKQKRALVITAAIFVILIVVLAIWNFSTAPEEEEIEGTRILPETIERLSADPSVPPLPPLTPEVLRSLGSDR